jgi:DNA-binding FrmR family transcriptional regulator
MREADLHPQAVAREDLELLDVVLGARSGAVELRLHRVRATRVVADHPAKSAVVMRGRVWSERQAQASCSTVEEDRYCIDVVTQINAAGAALDKVALGLLDGHVRHCLVGGHGGPSDPDEQAEELMGAVGRMLTR